MRWLIKDCNTIGFVFFLLCSLFLVDESYCVRLLSLVVYHGQKKYILNYFKAEIAMDRHRLGEIENGYKMVIAMELLEESTKRGEKMLIFRCVSLLLASLCPAGLQLSNHVLEWDPLPRWLLSSNVLYSVGRLLNSEMPELHNHHSVNHGLGMTVHKCNNASDFVLANANSKAALHFRFQSELVGVECDRRVSRKAQINEKRRLDGVLD